MEHAEPVADRWSLEEADGLSDLETLVYLSRLLGSDPRLVLWGGGNTSLKIVEQDYRGRETDVLRIKGSGSDLKAATARDFPGVRLDDVRSLLALREMDDAEMVRFLAFSLLDPAAPRPSIETLLHGFIPARCVVHSHADAILALCNNSQAGEILRRVYGERMALIPYYRPGFTLSRLVHDAVTERPDLDGVILLYHGLITWHDDPAAAYHRHIAAVNEAIGYVARSASPGAALGPPAGVTLNGPRRQEVAASLAPLLRGLCGQSMGTGLSALRSRQPSQPRMVLHFDDGEDVRRFVCSERAHAVIEQGAATPDHILNIKRTPL